MEFAGLISSVIGLLLMIIFSIVLLIRAFQTSILWGLGYLFIPLVGLFFLFIHWDVAKSPFMKCFLGLVLVVVGGVLNPGVGQALLDGLEN